MPEARLPRYAMPPRCCRRKRMSRNILPDRCCRPHCLTLPAAPTRDALFFDGALFAMSAYVLYAERAAPMVFA